MAEKVEFRKIREFGELIGDTFLFIKQNFKPLGKAFIYICGIFILGGIISSILTQLQIIDFQSTSYPSSYRNNPFDAFSKVGFPYLLVILFMMLSYTAIYITILSYIALYVQKGNVAPSVEEVWSYFKFYFLRMLGSGIVMSIFGALCFICCVIPGIYVFPALTIFYPIMIIENGSIGYSFNRSFKLIKDEWWITAAVIIIIWIITYACMMLIQLPSIIVAMVGAFTNVGNPITKTYIFLSSILQYIAYILTIIPLICGTLIYFNLVERKESSGLIDRIGSLGQATDQTNIHPEEY
ncbi:hypothetical protein [Pedobacter nototheniae]|uniref:hypothetical protein n=1 Tax=Pedobacter nototheniae TaxID=2488994 RepID=UPI00103AF0EF|nr:hypothetical protein [Pedobacter nototheniae]